MDDQLAPGLLDFDLSDSVVDTVTGNTGHISDDEAEIDDWHERSRRDREPDRDRDETALAGIVVDEMDENAVTARIPRAARRRRGVVLVVDDSEDAQELFARSLEDAGYSVLTAANGREALEVLTSHPLPNLILLDLFMPVMDGLEFIHVMRSYSRLAPVPVVVVSALDADETERIPETRRLQKPVREGELLRSVEDAIHSELH